MPIRFVVQSVHHAALLVDNSSEWVRIGRGAVVYLSIMKDTAEDRLPIIARKLVNYKVFGGEVGRRTSLMEGGDLLIVPQACLAGKIRSTKVQYHAQIDKAVGKRYYDALIDHVRRLLSANGDKVITAPPSRYSTTAASSGDPIWSQTPIDTQQQPQAAEPTIEKAKEAKDKSAIEEEEKASTAADDSQKKATAEKDGPLPGRRLLQYGTYGNTQGLQLLSTGPNTHFFDLS